MTKKEEINNPMLQSFSTFMTGHIKNLEEEERYATAHVYRYALHSFTLFVGGGEVFFGAINRRSLSRFEAHLRDNSKAWNTISTYVRALRSVYHRAVDASLITGQYRLFSGVFTGTKINQKRALPPQHTRQLLIDKEHSAPLRQSSDLLTLMLRLQGMPFVDLMHLRCTDLQTDVQGNTLLVCHRRKTGTELRVVVAPQAQLLIERYRSTDPTSPYLLRFLDGVQPGKERHQAYTRLLRNLNASLAKLPTACGLTGVKLSSYTARHTWATTAKRCHVPEEVISEGLGHSSLNVTRTYLKSFDNNVLQQANKLVMESLLDGIEKHWK